MTAKAKYRVPSPTASLSRPTRQANKKSWRSNAPKNMDLNLTIYPRGTAGLTQQTATYRRVPRPAHPSARPSIHVFPSSGRPPPPPPARLRPRAAPVPTAINNRPLPPKLRSQPLVFPLLIFTIPGFQPTPIPGLLPNPKRSKPSRSRAAAITRS